MVVLVTVLSACFGVAAKTIISTTGIINDNTEINLLMIRHNFGIVLLWLRSTCATHADHHRNNEADNNDNDAVSYDEGGIVKVSCLNCIPTPKMRVPESTTCAYASFTIRAVTS